jgi:hypothetical protein
MGNKKRKIKTLLIVVSILACVLFFLPKQRVIGGLGGGPITVGLTAYREDYACIGIKFAFCPPWPDYGCSFHCSGIITNKTCSIEKAEDSGINRTPVACISP